MAYTMKTFAACLILAISMQLCCSSAIPIWEFLSRNEKMSYLYSTFAQLVSVHCKATATSSSLPVNQCKHSFLAYGYDKLQTFSDAQLDTFDPYQRGASEIIWSNIMRDHPSAMLITTRKPFPTPPASSIIILTHQEAVNRPSVPTSQEQQHTSASAPTVAATTATSSSSEQHQFKKNPIFETGAEHKHQYAMNMDLAYGYPAQSANPQVDTFNYNPQQQHQQQHGSKPQQQQQTYLTGPLVFRVRPDGTPVEEDQNKPLPRDDDLEDYHVRTGSEGSSSNNKNNNNNNNSNTNNNNKHRRIATISALKQHHLATLAVQQQLQPPLQQQQYHQQQQQRLRRHYQYPVSQQPLSPVNGYFYARAQA